jgi:hypothetical protein
MNGIRHDGAAQEHGREQDTDPHITLMISSDAAWPALPPPEAYAPLACRMAGIEAAEPAHPIAIPLFEHYVTVRAALVVGRDAGSADVEKAHHILLSWWVVHARGPAADRLTSCGLPWRIRVRLTKKGRRSFDQYRSNSGKRCAATEAGPPATPRRGRELPPAQGEVREPRRGRRGTGGQQSQTRDHDVGQKRCAEPRLTTCRSIGRVCVIQRCVAALALPLGGAGAVMRWGRLMAHR